MHTSVYVRSLALTISMHVRPRINVVSAACGGLGGPRERTGRHPGRIQGAQGVRRDGQGVRRERQGVRRECQGTRREGQGVRRGVQEGRKSELISPRATLKART